MGSYASKKRTIEVGNKHWLIGRLLGKGSYSQVRLLTQKNSNQMLALKLIEKRNLLTRGPGAIEGAISEREILQSFSHPFIVNLVASYETKKELLIILEFLPGGALSYHLRLRQSFRDHEAKWVAANLLIALRAMRRRRIVHRDLKPENILFDTQGYLKITDFNCARVLSDPHKKLQGRAGTIDYMAPEVIEGSYDESSDMWSFGVLIYRALYGFLPWDLRRGKKNSQQSWISSSFDSAISSHMGHYVRIRANAITTGNISFPKERTSSAARRFLRRVLVRSPALRPTPEEAMQDPWFVDINWNELRARCLRSPFHLEPDHIYLSQEILIDDQFEVRKSPFGRAAKSISDSDQHAFDRWEEWVSPMYQQNFPGGNNNSEPLLQFPSNNVYAISHSLSEQPRTSLDEDVNDPTRNAHLIREKRRKVKKIRKRRHRRSVPIGRTPLVLSSISNGRPTAEQMLPHATTQPQAITTAAFSPNAQNVSPLNVQSQEKHTIDVRPRLQAERRKKNKKIRRRRRRRSVPFAQSSRLNLSDSKSS